MLDLRGGRAAWPQDLKSWSDEPSDREPFASWWSRVNHRLPGLHSAAAEQWIHRHFHHSPFYGISLEGLSSRLERWTTQSILNDVYIGEPLHPEFTYSQLRHTHTAKTMMETGTWDYPLLVMHAPEGFLDWVGEHPDCHYCLIEGHQRFRFLNALAHRGDGQPMHDVLVLSYRTP